MQNDITLMDAALLRKFLLGGCNHLGAHKDEVNALNVFPVPDGDTGINMYLTVASAGKKIEQSDLSQGIGKLAGDFAMGTLMGARGNSGVILSQIFRGISVSLKGKDSVSVKDFAAALQKGVDLSYKSVMKPVEGTILTVYRHIAKEAVSAANHGASCQEMLRHALKAGESSLANTPNLLPVLKEAGVVDAGGKGILYFMEGALLALDGDESVLQQAAATQTAAEPIGAAKSDISTADIEFIYCTQLLIKGENLPIDTIREHLMQEPPGDSLLVVGDDTVIKIHYHNNHPGQVLEYCSQFGSLHDIIIDNMYDQHHENVAAFEEQQAAPQLTEEASGPRTYSRKCGVLAVCAGEGMAEIYRQLDADIISGGQTMNPSAEDLMLAIENIDAEEVIILPNNSNIILTAQQVKQLTDRKVEIVPTKYVTQGLNALLNFNQTLPAEENVAAMQDACADTVNGELTYAVRDTKYNGIDIHENDLLALMQGKITGCGQDLQQTLLDLLQQMVDAKEEAELITLYYGQDIDEEQAAALEESVCERFPDMEVEVFSGGQPLYYFLAAVD